MYIYRPNQKLPPSATSDTFRSTHHPPHRVQNRAVDKQLLLLFVAAVADKRRGEFTKKYISQFTQQNRWVLSRDDQSISGEVLNWSSANLLRHSLTRQRHRTHLVSSLFLIYLRPVGLNPKMLLVFLSTVSRIKLISTIVVKKSGAVGLFSRAASIFLLCFFFKSPCEKVSFKYLTSLTCVDENRKKLINYRTPWDTPTMWL